MKEMLSSASKETRKYELGDADHHLFVHDLLDADLSEADVSADMMTVAVGGFHTTGLRALWLASTEFVVF